MIEAPVRTCEFCKTTIPTEELPRTGRPPKVHAACRSAWRVYISKQWIVNNDPEGQRRRARYAKLPASKKAQKADYLRAWRGAIRDAQQTAHLWPEARQERLKAVTDAFQAWVQSLPVEEQEFIKADKDLPIAYWMMRLDAPTFSADSTGDSWYDVIAYGVPRAQVEWQEPVVDYALIERSECRSADEIRAAARNAPIIPADFWDRLATGELRLFNDVGGPRFVMRPQTGWDDSELWHAPIVDAHRDRHIGGSMEGMAPRHRGRNAASAATRGRRSPKKSKAAA